MKILLAFLLAFALAGAIFFSSLGKAACSCGCLDCGKSCVNQCDGMRCIPGEKCCDNCICKK